MLKIKLKGTEQLFLIDRVSFENQSENAFILQSSMNDKVLISVPYVLHVDASYKFSEFECVPFISSSYFKENDIFQVESNETKVGRLGWIFPVQALLSAEHSYANNEFFLKYAFVSCHKLLLGQFFSEDIEIEVDSLNTTIGLDYIYDTSLIVLTLSNSKTQLLDDYNIKNCLHDLYIQNFFYCANPSLVTSILKRNDGEEISKVRLSLVSPFLKDEIFVRSLFEDHLKSHNHPLVQFHFLYQIIELLIDKVYDSEIDEFITLAKLKAKSSHELKKAVEKILSEEYRIKKLFEKYLSKRLSSSAQLLNSCNEMLENFNNKKESTGEALYQVRNLLFHNFREVAIFDSDYRILKLINSAFERLLTEVLTYFTKVDAIDYKSPLPWLMYKLNQEKKTTPNPPTII